MLDTVASLAQLVLVGPISLDVELDAESLHDNGYKIAQRELAAHLNELTNNHVKSTGQAWTFDELDEQTLLFTPPGFTNRDLLPMAFLRFDSPEVTTKVAHSLRAVVGDEWSIASCFLNFFTFGFATIRLDLRQRTSDPQVGHAAIVEQFSHQLAERLPDTLKPVLRRYESGTRAILPQL